MKARDIMTAGPACCAPEDSIGDVARIMRDSDCGAVPVVDDAQRLVGIVTDRDLAVRGLARGKGEDSRVSEVMTAGPSCCRPNDDVRDVESRMAERQVRRIPVVDGDKRVVGIVAQADLARAALHGDRLTDREVAIVVERISEPARQTIARPKFSERELRLRAD